MIYTFIDGAWGFQKAPPEVFVTLCNASLSDGLGGALHYLFDACWKQPQKHLPCASDASLLHRAATVVGT